MANGYRDVLGEGLNLGAATQTAPDTTAYMAAGQKSDLSSLYARKSDLERQIAMLRSKLAKERASSEYKAYQERMRDPIYKSAAQRYIDTGDNSALQAWKNSKNAEEQQRVVREQMKAEKEKVERVGVQSALNKMQQAVDVASVEGQEPEAVAREKGIYNENLILLRDEYGYEGSVPEWPFGKKKNDAASDTGAAAAVSGSKDGSKDIYSASAITGDVERIIDEYMRSRGIHKYADVKRMLEGIKTPDESLLKGAAEALKKVEEEHERRTKPAPKLTSKENTRLNFLNQRKELSSEEEEEKKRLESKKKKAGTVQED